MEGYVSGLHIFMRFLWREEYQGSSGERLSLLGQFLSHVLPSFYKTLSSAKTKESDNNISIADDISIERE